MASAASAPEISATATARLSATIGLAAVALQELVEFSLQIPANAVLFGVVLAIAVHPGANRRVRTRGRSSSVRCSAFAGALGGWRAAERVHRRYVRHIEGAGSLVLQVGQPDLERLDQHLQALPIWGPEFERARPTRQTQRG